MSFREESGQLIYNDMINITAQFRKQLNAVTGVIHCLRDMCLQCLTLMVAPGDPKLGWTS